MGSSDHIDFGKWKDSYFAFNAEVKTMVQMKSSESTSTLPPVLAV